MLEITWMMTCWSSEYMKRLNLCNQKVTGSNNMQNLRVSIPAEHVDQSKRIYVAHRRKSFDPADSVNIEAVYLICCVGCRRCMNGCLPLPYL